MEMKNEIKIDEVNSHFSEIASKYRNLRKTDLEPILHIRNQLDEKPGISIADVGCGDGRYSLELLKSLGDECYLHCIDSNENMLQYLKEYMKENNVMNFCVRPGSANKMPLENESMDFIVTFNAIHHFDVQRFLEEAFGCLKENGRMFIYTRLRNQNSRNIWGQNFPLFAEIENRLFEFDELKHHIQDTGLKIENTTVFGYHRTSSLTILEEKARNKHYSTFSLYSDDTFEESLEEFKQNIRDNFDDLEKIQWQDENILLEISK